MSIEDKLIEYIIEEATEEEQREFFGYDYFVATPETCYEVIEQLPDEEFDKLIEKFGISTDSIKC